MSDILKLVGGNIRRMRKARQLTLEELAESSESNAKYLGGVERGEENISLKTLERVAEALKIRPYELLLPFEAGSLSDNLEAIIKTADTKTQLVMRDVLERVLRWKDDLTGPKPKRRSSSGRRVT